MPPPPPPEHHSPPPSPPTDSRKRKQMDPEYPADDVTEEKTEFTLDKDDIVPCDLVDLAHMRWLGTEEKGFDEPVQVGDSRGPAEEKIANTEMLLESADQTMRDETLKKLSRKKKKALKDDPRVERNSVMINEFLDKLNVDKCVFKRALFMCQTDMVFMGSDLDYWSLRSKKLEQGDPLNLHDVVVCFVQSYTMKANKMKIGADFRERMKGFSRETVKENLKFIMKSFDETVGICDYMLNIARRNMKFMIV